MEKYLNPDNQAFSDFKMKGDSITVEHLRTMFEKLISGYQTIFGIGLEQIILYGSVARGTHTEESDVDIAVIVRNYTEVMHRKMIDFTVDLELEYDKVLSVVVIKYNDFKEWENVLPFYINVKKDGVKLWSVA